MVAFSGTKAVTSITGVNTMTGRTTKGILLQVCASPESQNQVTTIP